MPPAPGRSAIVRSTGSGDHHQDRPLRICGERQITYVPFFAVSGTQGARAANLSADDQVIACIVYAHHATPAQIRLAWTLHQGDHVLAIPGTGNPDHLVQNIAAGAIRLTDHDPGKLNRIAQN